LEKTKTLMATILLTGARAPVTLELCRAFAQQRHRVFIADVLFMPIARWSAFAVQYFTIPPPAQQLPEFEQALSELIVKYQIEHLIPTCEETFYVSKIKDRLPCRVWTSDFDLMLQLHHKHRFLDLAKGFFQVPATFSCSEFEDWQLAKNYVFKPIFSRFASRVIIGQDEAQCLEPREHPQDWIAQQRLFGQEICVYSIWRKGQLGGFAAYQPKHRVGKGSSLFFEPFFQQDIFEAVLKFGQHYQFDGQLSFDLMLCTDGMYVLECNPRSISGVHLLGKELESCFFSEQTIVHRSEKAKAVKAAWFLMQPWQFFSQHYTETEDVIWHPKDIAPFLLQGLSALEMAYLAIRHHQSMIAVSTRDIEFNGE